MFWGFNEAGAINAGKRLDERTGLTAPALLQ